MQRHILKRYSKLPHSLNGLRVFEVSARYLSFTDAAIELNVTQSAVSRQIRHLEDNLGFDLFIRQHRQLQLTNEGAELAILLSRHFGELDRAIYDLSPSKQNELNIKTETSLAARWLTPRLKKFRKLFPDLQVNVTISWFQNGANVNLESGGYDVAIFGEKYPDSRYIDNVLRPEYMAPIYLQSLAEDGQLLAVEQALSLPHIHPTLDRSDWRQWLMQVQGLEQNSEQNIVFNSLDLSVSACLAGEGVAIMDLLLVLELLQQNTLCLPKEATIIESPWKYYYYVAPEAKQTTEVAAFIQWMRDEIAADIQLLSDLAQINNWTMPK